MKFGVLGILLVCFVGLADSYAGVVTNWVADSGFEGLEEPTSPENYTNPWQSNEPDGVYDKVVREENEVHSGIYAVRNFKYSGCRIRQSLGEGFTVDSNALYEISFYMQLNGFDPSRPSLSSVTVQLYTTTNGVFDSPMKWVKGWGDIIPSSTNAWEKQTVLFAGSDLNRLMNRHGQYLRFSIWKEKWNTQHDVLIDDVEFGESQYPSWIASYGLIGADAELTADPDRDGLSNKKEYLLGTTPSAPHSDANGYDNGAEREKDPDRLIKLREEYQKDAQGKISPINDRYLVKLKWLEVSFGRETETYKAVAIRKEIEALERNPAHLIDTLFSNAEQESEPRELIDLRRDHQRYAQKNISSVNVRYLEKLKRLERLFGGKTEALQAIAVRKEIELIEANPAHLLLVTKEGIKNKKTFLAWLIGTEWTGHWIHNNGSKGDSSTWRFYANGKVEIKTIPTGKTPFEEQGCYSITGTRSLKFEIKRYSTGRNYGGRVNFKDDYQKFISRSVPWGNFEINYTGRFDSTYAQADKPSEERKVKVRYAQVVSDLEFVPIQIGEKAFPMTNLRWVSVPKSLDSFFASKEKVEFLNFTVRKGGIVRILSGWGEKEYLMDKGWKLIGLAQLTNDSGGKKTWYFFERRLSEGSFSLKSASWIGLRLVLPDIPQE